MPFEDQAASFDRRAGLPPGVAAEVADAIAAAAEMSSGDVLLEIGVGTGEIGVHLAGLPIRYAGIDSAEAMLRAFLPDRVG